MVPLVTSPRKVTKVFSQGSYKLGHDREDKMVNADGGADGEDDEEREEEEIDYGYGVIDEEAELEDKEEVDSDGQGGDLGPEDGEENWEDDVLELEGYAAL
jgi:hypothetical protein